MGRNHLGGRVCLGLGLLLAVAPARAQSTATFPTEPGAATPAPAPAAQPPVSPLPPQPVPSALPPQPQPSAQSYPLAQRGPSDSQYPPATRSDDIRPPLLPYRDGLPVPPGYHVEDRSERGLLIGGSLLFGAGYGAALIVAAGDSFNHGTGWMAVPLVGPWASIAARNFSCRPTTTESTRACVRDAFDEVETIVFITVDGLVQATGLGLLLAGAASGSQELVRDDLKIGLVPPLPGRRGWQLGVSSTF